MYGSTDKVLFQNVYDEKGGKKLLRSIHKTEVLNNSAAEPFHSTRLMLGVIGALPFTWRKPHPPSLHPFKSTFVLALVTICYLGSVEYHLILSCLQHLANEEMSLKDAIMFLELTIFSLFYFVNFAVWSDVAATKGIVAKWIRLGKLFEEMTGRQLAPRNLSLENFFNFVFAVFPYICFVLAKISNPQIDVQYYHCPVIGQGSTVAMIVCFLWMMYFGMLGTIATLVNADLQKDIKTNTLTSQKLYRYREIWLQMRSISDSASSFNAPMLILVLIAALIVFFTYEITLLFRSGEVFSMIAHFIICVALIFFISFTASATSSGINKIKEFYDSILAREGLLVMNDAEQREVIVIYLSEKTRRLVPTYGGFVIVSKRLVSSIFAAVATYLVVLVQFTYSTTQIKSRSHTHGNLTV